MSIDSIAPPAPSTRSDSPGHPGISGRPIRTLIAGAGYIAEYHLAILRENPTVDIVGICDPHPDRVASFKTRWNIPHATATLTELAGAVQADAVHVLTPPQTHKAVIAQALDARLHVLAEKPLALRTEDHDALAAVAERQRLRLDANHNAAWHPQFLRLKADIDARRLGALQHVVAIQNVPLAQLAAGAHGHWMFAEPRNVLYEQAPHPLSQICDLLGPVERASTTCTGRRTLRTGAAFYDTWHVTLECAAGSAQLYMAFDGSFPYWQLHVIGQDASARLDLLGNTYTLDRATTSVPPVDAFRRGLSRGWSEIGGVSKQLTRYIGSSLRVTGRRDPYYVSMKGSIDAFYRRLEAGGLDVSVPLDLDVSRAMDLITAAMPREQGLDGPVSAPAIVRSTRESDVLVIGSTGFIGQHLVGALAAAGSTVRVMARTPSALPDAVRSAAPEISEGDVRDPEAVARAVAGCRRVIHLVAGAPEGWSEYERLYLDGTRYVADACLAHRVEQFQFASSIAALYLGEPGATVTNATPADQRLDERCDYAKAKGRCERMLLELHGTKGLPVVIVRPGIVVGAGGPPEHLGVGHWASPTRCVSWGSADHPLPFVLVSDVARAMASVASRSGLEGRAFNLVGDVPLRASEYVTALAALSRRDVQLHTRSLAEWWALEHFGWAVKAVGRKPNNAALSWRELKYRTGASRLDCSDSKQTLQWAPEANRDRFIDQGIRAAVRTRP